MIKLYKEENNEKVEVENLNDMNNPFIIALDDTDNIINTNITNKTNNIKVDIIGIEYKDENEIVDQVILPYILKDNRLNIMTLGRTTDVYELIENKLEERLKELDYSEEDIEKIISRISLISVLSNSNTSNLKANTISFVDVNNEVIKTEEIEEYKRVLNETKQDSLFGTFGTDNNILFIHNGTGNNSYKEYLKNTSFLSILSYYLDTPNKNLNAKYKF